MSFLSTLFRRSSRVPEGIQYLPIEVMRQAIEQRNQDFGGPAFWEPTQEELAAGNDGQGFSLWQYVKKILNQLKEGSCTANGWAGAYAGTSVRKTADGTPMIVAPHGGVTEQNSTAFSWAGAFNRLRAFGKSEDASDGVWLARQYIYWYERQLHGNTGTDSGANVGDGATVLSQQGAPLETDYPYSDDPAQMVQQPPAALNAEAAQHKIIDPMRVRAQIEHLKAALKARFFVVYGFMVYASFESQSTTRTGVVTMPAKGEKILGGHCMYFIGYTDSAGKAHYYRRRDTLRYGILGGLLKVSHAVRVATGFTVLAVSPPADCVIGVNSWSDSVGDGGRYYFPIEYINRYASDFYIFKDITD